MKKFLSLLLALVMTMSLVTISAGATEYKDLTDKDELGPQYQEAVAVLNKIGVITGYDDGSFRPDVELTRGAAAKIIVSLLIGPEAASNLANSTAPYPDVPVSHTFAGVISYCKNAKIIDGYGDGTFRPADPLSGYAFAKMLLSALGYDNTIEGFVGTGWTNNVLNIGQEASLFDRLDFKGSETVSRKDAALLALNTLKATVVEYTNGQNITVTGDNTNVVLSTDPVRSYKLSNQDYARNILPKRRDISQAYTSRADYNTVEFAEEHFVDLRLPHDKYDPIDDAYGRPSAEWTYKKLSIGKFPLVPDFEYTSQVAHDVETVTDAAKVRALELSGYKVSRDADEADAAGNKELRNTRLWINGYAAGTLSKVADIADLTDNGTLVEVYVDNNGADFITDVVVIKSQLMEVKRTGADYITLDVCDADSESAHAVRDIEKKTPIYGFNQEAVELTINKVEVGDDYYDLLSGLKVGDRVVVEPVAVEHDTWNDWDVGHAYVPETVKGTLNGVPERFGTVGVENGYSALSVDVGGTTYKVSLWNDSLYDITPDAVKVTKKDVTLTLDRYGYALLAEDVGAMDGWLIVGNYRQSIENGILVTYANGWDLSGNEVSLNIGARAGVTGWTASSASDDVWDQNALPRIGSLVKYSSSTTSNTADWDLSQANEKGVYNVYQGQDETGLAYYLRANSSTVTVTNAATTDLAGRHLAVTNDDNLTNKAATETVLMGNSMKYIYVSFDDSGELDSIEITTNRTKVDSTELKIAPTASNGNGHLDAQAAVEMKTNADGVNEAVGVKAVVIKRDNSDASYKNLMYIVSYKGSAMRDAEGQMVQGYEVAMMDENGKATLTTVYAYNTTLKPGNFVRYTKGTHVDHPDDFYTLRVYEGTKGRSAAVLSAFLRNYKDGNNNLWTLYGIEPDTTKGRTVSSFNIGDTQPGDRSLFSTNVVENWDTFADWMVNLRGASWVDLTKNGIDSVDDLKDVFNDDDLDHRGENRIDVTLLFNDDISSDYFRGVYLIIITGVVDHKGPYYENFGDDTQAPETSTNVVRMAESIKGQGTVSGGTLTTYPSGTGTTLTGVKLTAPVWADVVSTNGKDSAGAAKAVKSLKYQVMQADGTPYAPAATATVADDLAWDSNAGAYDVTFSNTELNNLAEAGEGAYIAITDLTWTQVLVKYTDGTNDLEMDPATTPTKAVTTSAVGTAISFQTSDAYAGTGTWTVSGAKVATDGDDTTGTVIANTVKSIGTWVADGTGYVTVKVTGFTENANANKTVSSTIKDGSNYLLMSDAPTPALAVNKIDTSLTGDLKVALYVNGLTATNGVVSIGATATAALKLKTAAGSDTSVSSYNIVVKYTQDGRANSKEITGVTAGYDALVRNFEMQDGAVVITGLDITEVKKPSIQETAIRTLTSGGKVYLEIPFDTTLASAPSVSDVFETASGSVIAPDNLTLGSDKNTLLAEVTSGSGLKVGQRMTMKNSANLTAAVDKGGLEADTKATTFYWDGAKWALDPVTVAVTAATVDDTTNWSISTDKSSVVAGEATTIKVTLTARADIEQGNSGAAAATFAWTPGTNFATPATALTAAVNVADAGTLTGVTYTPGTKTFAFDDKTADDTLLEAGDTIVITITLSDTETCDFDPLQVGAFAYTAGT